MELGNNTISCLNASNAELIDQCRGGNAEAWNELVKRYQRLVYAIPIREGLSIEDAAEVSQQTFAILVKELHSIREPARLSSWLMTVTRREVWRRRRAATDAIEELTDPATTDAGEHTAVGDWTDRHAEVAWIYDAVHSLGEPCRSLVLGLFFDPTEPSYAAVAVSLGRPLGSIGPLRARCLQRLRSALGSEFL